MRPIRDLIAAGIPLAALLFIPAVHAQETKTYTYDALGRVTGVVTSGGPANGTNSGYTYDAAGNRKQVNVTGSPNGTASSGDAGGGASVGTTRYIVVPLNGFTLIPISQ